MGREMESVKIITSPVTMEITDGKRTKVVHVNRLQPRIQPSVEEDVNSGVQHIQRVEPLYNVQCLLSTWILEAHLQ